MTAGHRIVLKDGVSRDDVDDAMQANGWRLCNVIAASATHPFQLIFTDRAREGTLFFVQDARLDAGYCVPSTDALSREARASLPHWGDDEIRALGGTARGVILAALALSPVDARAAVAAAKEADDAELRAAAELVEPYL